MIVQQISIQWLTIQDIPHAKRSAITCLT